MPPPARRA